MNKAKPPVAAAAKTMPDVVPPGGSVPPLTSRAIIVPKRSILKDPMVTERPAEADKPSLQPASTGKVPLTPSPAPTPEPSAKDAPAESGKPASPPLKQATDSNQPTTSSPKNEAAQTLKTTEAETGATTGPAEEARAIELQAKHDAAVQKLMDNKQYFLPINTVEKRKTKHFVILGVVLSLFLMLAWADIALDAGLIQINGVKPVTHFFSN